MSPKQVRALGIKKDNLLIGRKRVASSKIVVKMAVNIIVKIVFKMLPKRTC